MRSADFRKYIDRLEALPKVGSLQVAEILAEIYADGLAAGAESMREAAAKCCLKHAQRERNPSSYREGIADGADRCERDIRALPLPATEKES